jgi:hypothetical protein
MKISIGWDDNSRQDLILIRYLENYTWDELEEASNKVYAMMRSVAWNVDIISILNPTVHSPRDGDSLFHFRATLKRMPPNLGIYINVGQNNAFSRLFFNTLLKIYPTPFNMKSVASEAKAREILAQKRSK